MQRFENITVHKFGGSSLADADCFKRVAKLLKGQKTIVIVSAMGGMTAALQALLEMAVQEESYQSELNNVVLRAKQAALDLGLSQDLLHAIEADVTDLKDVLHAIAISKSYGDNLSNFVLSYGERWSARMLAAYLDNELPSTYLDASQYLITKKHAEVIAIDWEKTLSTITHFLKDSNCQRMVITGFIAADQKGQLTTLGPNTSDYSAAVFARLFKAKELCIWTDVNGVMSANPAQVPQAFSLESLSYKEALELAYFGASVIHPKTIAPLIDQNIPIIIKNTFYPDFAGTRIDHNSDPSQGIKGLSSIDNVTLINVQGTGMIGVSGIAARVFSALSDQSISVVMISQASSEYSICIAIMSEQTQLTLNILEHCFRFDIQAGYIEHIRHETESAIVAVVGDGMVGAVGTAGKITQALARAGVNIRAMAQGSSERNVSLVVKQAKVAKALRAIHSAYHLSPRTLSVGLIGPGLIGRTFLEQLSKTLDKIQVDYEVNIRLRGIANSKNMLLADTAIEFDAWSDDFAQCQEPLDISRFAEHIRSADIPHGVIIDTTASKHVASHYLQFFNQGLHVITPNKQANAGSMQYYKDLRKAAKASMRQYFYETTVCAGLPVIQTLRDLIQTGDTIHSVEAVLSGTLAFIFAQLRQGATFSQAVLLAKKQGYTEPDPRQDLSGMDVARKITCLAREIGWSTDLSDISVTNLVPQQLREVSTEEFLKQLPDFDAQMQTQLDAMLTPGQALAYVARINETGQVTVGVDAFAPEHPIGRLGGTDNIILFHTERYSPLPLVVQGPGAGAPVTAAGVLADLLRLLGRLG